MKRLLLTSLVHGRQLLQTGQGAYLLIADPDMIGALGVGYFVGISQMLRQEFRHLSLALAIPCHCLPSLVFAALEHPIAGIFFDDDHPLWPKVVSLGQQKDVFVNPMTELARGMAD